MSVPQSPKVLTVAEFMERRKALPEGYRLVFTNGCFDLLHPGHVDYLARARALGDGLMVGLNSDASVRRLGKGAERPVNPQEARAYVLAGLESVDFVIVFDEDTPLELVSQVRPQVLVKGGDWPVERIVGREVVEGDGGTVLSIPLLEGFSTTDTVRRIREGLSAGCS
ncbi:D-glycero-beta-D-manno-heptose 1-phosphate adenylyltransferase [Salidesulfovibrio brasiliensis]|uniref:D-glycero-beta-D-manno-heptose 1-phosphate adenylyltransferase n=1 Tax=Salidesulfovibrio brasiliensis TaxID=221711 RepID=UPI0006D04827|nr:D-glycero-beta-D-manno-heptose 1-phosphate adenylyltransferase [Salidesulfovibrio brasiliensis]